MTENNYDLERYTQLKKAVQAAKNLGVNDLAKRRELVIDAKGISNKVKTPWINESDITTFPSVAKSDLRDEDTRVTETSINKYFEVHNPDCVSSQVLIEALHSQKPKKGEVNRTNGQIGEALTSQLADRYEPGTREIAIEVSDALHVPCFIAKKSRIGADLNRSWFKQTITEKVVLANGEKTSAKSNEFSRSGRAALYWATRKILTGGNLLDGNEKAIKPIFALSIHGMKDREDYGFAVGGMDVESASEDVLKWFTKRLGEELVKQGIIDPAVLATGKVAPDYVGLPSMAHYRNEPEDIKNKQHPSFGVNFNKVQLEIGRRFRQEGTRSKVALAITMVLKEFPDFSV